ncbi:hypothetical protein [Novosphingobium profundi]|uniref:hypothetical protein n=1 Tax=Novosphingobium profundi TaxID=1774954 RepID=UPI001CFF3098|nr:hypothetical protein [Novosphingobium profundi]
MNLKTALIAASISSAALAPAVAQANTTAAESAGKIASLSGVGTRASTPVAKKQKAEAGIIVLGVVAAGAATYGIIEATDSDDNTSSGS